MTNYTILDCYTDEPAGLGVPPYIGTYPRYIYGTILDQEDNVKYITIDDLRLLKKYDGIVPILNDKKKTKIEIYNLTKNSSTLIEIFLETDILIVILGVHVPGKYLSAIPGTLKEIEYLTKDLKCEKILTGPAASIHGTQLEGGKLSEEPNKELWNKIDKDYFKLNSFDSIKKVAIKGAKLLDELNDLDRYIMEIETSSGCFRDQGCSFCVECKKPLSFRQQKDIIDEIKELKKHGAKNIRLGKQTCFYSYKNSDPKEIEKLLKPLSELKLKTLHIDNVNPAKVTEDITKIITKYCTSGNIAAFGIESFDENVIKLNNLNSNPITSIKAIEIINKYGKKIGDNGMPKFLPGINILFGLNAETKQTHKINMKYLQEILDKKLLVRRINIRKVLPLKGTKLYDDCGNKFLRKNKRYYWKWRDEIRKKIDYEMLKKLIPIGTILKDCYAEIHEKNVTFCRQIGTYPLIIGVKQRLELKKFYDIKITSHMLRSITGEIIT